MNAPCTFLSVTIHKIFGKKHIGEKLKCPVCGREIDTQASVEIPTSTTPINYEGASLLLRGTDLGGVAHADLVYKGGEYFLVFPSNVTCPFCKEIFCLDIWVSVLKQFLLEETKD